MTFTDVIKNLFALPGSETHAGLQELFQQPSYSYNPDIAFQRYGTDIGKFTSGVANVTGEAIGGVVKGFSSGLAGSGLLTLIVIGGVIYILYKT